MGIPHDNEALGTTDPVRLNPDFWINFMWKRIMGSTVLNATVNTESLDPHIRVYAHCGVPPSPHAPKLLGLGANQMGLVLININTSTTGRVRFDPGFLAKSVTLWTLTAGDGVFGETTLLNAHPLQPSIADGVPIGTIPVAGNEVRGDITLPPFSVTFGIAECPVQ
jgi:hypothetical protein